MTTDAFRLSAGELRRRTDLSEVGVDSTEQAQPLDHIIGQERAIRAIEFGMEMPGEQYNIAIVGRKGSGRSSVANLYLQKQACRLPVPQQWCYVNNFEDPRSPIAISVNAGQATVLRKEMDELVAQLRRDIPRTLDGDLFSERRREIAMEYQTRQQQLMQDLESYLQERGFTLIRSQTGLNIAPVINGEVLSSEAYDRLDPETKRRLEGYRPELMEKFEDTMRKTRDLDREGRQALERVRDQLVGFLVDQQVEDVRSKFPDAPKIVAYLAAVRKDVIENADRFMPDDTEQQQALPFFLRRGEDQGWFSRYTVNVLADSSPDGCAPVVVETNPSYQNLIGRVEFRAEFGAMATDFTQIQPGALHRANGGYLVLEARDLLSQPMAWDGLKRALKTREIRIESVNQFYGLVSTVTLEPEPIPLQVKVVIICDELLYRLLSTDEDFGDLFRIKAEFRTSMPRDDQAVRDYTSFIGEICREQKLRQLDASAVAAVLDESSRTAEDQYKLSTRMSGVVDLVRQASYWATQAGHDLVTAEDVARAAGERIYRLSAAAERYVEEIGNGVVLIDTQGATEGQVNGLSVVSMSDYQFGIPSRVTARTFLGRAGVVSIDREVKMSGPIHDKGALILAAWLGSRFAQKVPLSMSATLTFEQSYAGVEGDSAASTELYAILSSLSGIPLRQSIAVTGSVNQAGVVQAIGGANSKIEGFFDVCKALGLTGEQGVMIPRSNMRHLMLREDVVQAVRDGKFHIYAVSTIEEGIEVLTGVPAGVADAEGNYPADSVFGHVQARLAEYARLSKEKPAGEEEHEASEDEAKPAPGAPTGDASR